MAFKKGNKYGQGRPPAVLKSPEILLPVIFSKGNLNWARDFMSIYRKLRDDPMSVTKEQHKLFAMLYDLLPYLVTKIQVKDLDLEKLIAKESAQDAKNQTAQLLKLLENEQRPQAGSDQAGVADGKPPLSA